MPPRLLVTGFGEFAGIAKNPTQEVVEWLGSLDTRSHSSACSNGKDSPHVLSTTVLKVSATAVDDFLRQQLPRLEELARTGSDPLVLLHFGVDATVGHSSDSAGSCCRRPATVMGCMRQLWYSMLWCDAAGQVACSAFVVAGSICVLQYALSCTC
jgi:hypothetical protein